MKFDGPIPGENYTANTKNYAWHRPPDLVDYDEAVSYMIDKIDEPQQIEIVYAMLGADAHISTVVSSLLLQAISVGKFSIDLALLIAGPLARYVEIAAKDVGIKYDMGIDDPDRIIITPTLLKQALGLIEQDEDEEGDMPEEVSEQPTPEAATGGLMAMPEAGTTAPEDEQAAMLGMMTSEEEEIEDELQERVKVCKI